ncbi:MAG TPA: ATP-binding protein [Solirubrobacteraceae bacterium]
MSAAHNGGTEIPGSEQTEAALRPLRGQLLAAAPSPVPHDRRRGGGQEHGRRLADLQRADPRLSHERRRIAADVHDLVMQDVAFALATAREIAGNPAVAERYAAAAVAAAERALTGARSIVSELSHRHRRPPVMVLRESVVLAARATPLTLAIVVPDDSFADETTTDALVHIAREAVTNAVKHAGAGAIHVTLSRPDEWHLGVHDDGRGFDPAEVRGGFGLDSCRRHAEELGGRVLLTSAPGEGTAVQVYLP